MPRRFGIPLAAGFLLLLSGCSHPPLPKEKPVIVQLPVEEPAKPVVLPADKTPLPEPPKVKPTVSVEAEPAPATEAMAETPPSDDEPLERPATKDDERGFIMVDFDTTSGKVLHYDERANEAPVRLVIQEEEGKPVLLIRVELTDLLTGAPGVEARSSRYIVRTDRGRYILSRETPGLDFHTESTPEGRRIWLEKPVTEKDHAFMKHLADSRDITLELKTHFTLHRLSLSEAQVKAAGNMWRYFETITPR